jgi:hypothetical protein
MLACPHHISPCESCRSCTLFSSLSSLHGVGNSHSRNWKACIGHTTIDSCSQIGDDALVAAEITLGKYLLESLRIFVGGGKYTKVHAVHCTLRLAILIMLRSLADSQSRGSDWLSYFVHGPRADTLAEVRHECGICEFNINGTEASHIAGGEVFPLIPNLVAQGLLLLLPLPSSIMLRKNSSFISVKTMEQASSDAACESHRSRVPRALTSFKRTCVPRREIHPRVQAIQMTLVWADS